VAQECGDFSGDAQTTAAMVIPYLWVAATEGIQIEADLSTLAY
jgi:hypothetical protein